MTVFWDSLGILSVVTTIVFIVLKLTSVIMWNWFLVLLPFIAYVGLVLISIIFVFIVMHITIKEL